MNKNDMFINYAEVPIILQREPQECGAVALEMVFSHFGKWVPWKELLSDTINEDGYCSGATVLRAAKKHGFDAHAYKRDLMRIRETLMPCILYGLFNGYLSFVVLEGFKDEKVIIIDPSCGRKEYTIDEVSEAYKDIVITVRPYEKTKE